MDLVQMNQYAPPGDTTGLVATPLDETAKLSCRS